MENKDIEMSICTLDAKYNELFDKVKEITFRLENTERVGCDTFERVDRIERVVNKHLFSEDEDFIDITTLKSCPGCYCIYPLNHKKCDVCGYVFPEKVQNIDLITNEPEKNGITDHPLFKGVQKKLDMKPEDPEIIGDYMHWEGEDYYKIQKSGYYIYINSHWIKGTWKNIKDIEITDEIAKLRPWVKCICDLTDIKADSVFKLWGVDEYGYCFVTYEDESIEAIQKGFFTIATVADLKKAEIIK